MWIAVLFIAVALSLRIGWRRGRSRPADVTARLPLAADVRAALAGAEHWAMRGGVHHVAPEHLVAGLLIDETAPAWHALAERGVDPVGVRGRALSYEQGPDVVRDRPLPPTSVTWRVLKRAVARARWLGLREANGSHVIHALAQDERTRDRFAFGAAGS